MLDLLIDIACFVDARWHAMKKSIFRLAAGASLVCAAGILGLAGALAMLAALFLALSPHVGGAWAALISGLAALVAAVVVMCIGRWTIR